MAGVSAQWRDRVHAVVRQIPRGRVASYGLVALLAGRPGAARSVGTVMRECEDRTVPCHRVVHADGSLAAAFPGQRARLAREGVRFAGARVDVRGRLWTPRLPAVRAAGRARRGFSDDGSGRSNRTMRKASPAL